jgi:hypothetical protein
MARIFYISLLVAGVLLLAVGGWTVRGARWFLTMGREPQPVPAT